jgi:cell division protein FtsL
MNIIENNEKVGKMSNNLKKIFKKKQNNLKLNKSIYIIIILIILIIILSIIYI